MLPNLLVIGAAKSGTTSLHEYLRLHPEISMSRQKELHYFVSDSWRERRRWYEAAFEDKPIRGESSPTYTMYPYLPSTAERIRELTPDARFIYLVRDPVERSIANYAELAALRLESRPIGEALTDFSDPANPHLAPSRYATQLERFLEHFGEDRVLVIDQQELREQRLETLREVFSFLGVDPAFRTDEFFAEHNTQGVKVKYNDLGFWLVTHRIFTERSDRFERSPLRQPLRRLLSKPIDKALTPAQRAAVAAEMQPEIERLRRLTGKPLSSLDSARLES